MRNAANVDYADFALSHDVHKDFASYLEQLTSIFEDGDIRINTDDKMYVMKKPKLVHVPEIVPENAVAVTSPATPDGQEKQT